MHLKCVQFTAYQLYLNLFKVPGINFIRNIQDLTEENIKSLPKKKKKKQKIDVNLWKDKLYSSVGMLNFINLVQ